MRDDLAKPFEAVAPRVPRRPRVMLSVDEARAKVLAAVERLDPSRGSRAGRRRVRACR